MSNCKTCKYWSKNDPRLKDGQGQCIKASDTNSNIMEAACLSEGIDGELLTMPSFGCILYQEW